MILSGTVTNRGCDWSLAQFGSALRNCVGKSAPRKRTIEKELPMSTNMSDDKNAPVDKQAYCELVAGQEKI